DHAPRARAGRRRRDVPGPRGHGRPRRDVLVAAVAQPHARQARRPGAEPRRRDRRDRGHRRGREVLPLGARARAEGGRRDAHHGRCGRRAARGHARRRDGARPARAAAEGRGHLRGALSAQPSSRTSTTTRVGSSSANTRNGRRSSSTPTNACVYPSNTPSRRTSSTSPSSPARTGLGPAYSSTPVSIGYPEPEIMTWRYASPSTATTSPLPSPIGWSTYSTRHPGVPVPPSSRTTRSNPSWCPTRTSVTVRAASADGSAGSGSVFAGNGTGASVASSDGVDASSVGLSSAVPESDGVGSGASLVALPDGEGGSSDPPGVQAASARARTAAD